MHSITYYMCNMFDVINSIYRHEVILKLGFIKHLVCSFEKWSILLWHCSR